MKEISEQQASEILAGHGLAFGSWKQILAPAHLSASAMLGFEWHCYFVAKGKYGVRCAAFLDGVVDFVHGDQVSAKRLADKISQY